MKITAIITAGGSGSRFSKTGKPKQFINLVGKPVILYSLAAFQHSGAVNEIIVAAGKEYFRFIHNLAVKNNISKLNNLVEGGKTRFESVRNAFMQIERSSSKDIIIIHDAARPNIDIYFIDMLITILGKYDGVIPGMKIPETIKRARNNIITETLNRDELFLIQTPQVFYYDSLKRAYEKCGNKTDFTDEASLVEFSGGKVRITEGRKDNIKITVSRDMELIKSNLGKYPFKITLKNK